MTNSKLGAIALNAEKIMRKECWAAMERFQAIIKPYSDVYNAECDAAKIRMASTIAGAIPKKSGKP